MSETIFDHDRFDVYRLAVEYAAESFRVAAAQAGYGVEHEHEHEAASSQNQWMDQSGGSGPA